MRYVAEGPVLPNGGGDFCAYRPWRVQIPSM